MGNYFSNPITQLPPGALVRSTDVYPAVDTTNIGPTHPSGQANKYTVAQLAQFLQTQIGGGVIFSVLVATTANLNAAYNNGVNGVGASLTNSGALTALVIDGISLAVGDRVLVKDESTQAYNGIYAVSVVGSGSVAWVLTRTPDYDGSNPYSIQQGGFVIVVEGSTNELTTWIETNAGPFTVGTTPIVFQEQVVLSAVTNGTNLGSGDGIFAGLASTLLEFKSLKAGSNVTLTPTGTDITISSVGTVTGATNLGGDGLYTSLSGGNLQFKGLAAGSNITLTPSGSTISIASTNPGGTITGGVSLGGTNAVYAGTSGANLEFLGITAGTNVSIANDGVQLTISASGGGGGSFMWNAVAGTTQAASVANGYVCTNAALTTVTLPGTCAVGDLVSIQGAGVGGWVAQANTGQTVVQFNSGSTTTTAGTVTASGQYDAINLICVGTNTTWAINSSTSELLTFA